MSYRAGKSGIAAEVQRKIEANYDEEEARKVLNWIQLVSGTDAIPADASAIDASAGNFHEILRDGMVVCQLMEKLMPGKVNFKDKTFQTPKIEAMKVMRERERIALFTKLVQQYGVPETFTFPTESLHEQGALNLPQVCNCVRHLGIQAQTDPNYTGPDGFWPKKASRNVREFSAEQIKAGQNVIGLQMGSNKGASQAGMSMGKARHIID